MIVTPGPSQTFAAKGATSTIPIVFALGIDPVQSGLVASLNRPGGNITGVSLLNAELAGKQLDLLHELLPTATAVALLVNPSNPFNAELETTSLRDAARALGLQAHVLRASTPNEIDAAFRALVDLGAAALVVSGDAFFYKPTRADRRASGKNHSLDSPRGECAMLGSWLRLYV